jgi:hypothetical protein
MRVVGAMSEIAGGAAALADDCLPIDDDDDVDERLEDIAFY